MFLREGDIPHLFTFPGSAVRLCLEAGRAGVEIAGTRFTLSGEPITQARLDTVRQAGAVTIPRYGTMETGAIGYGCVNGEHPDEVHLLEDNARGDSGRSERANPPGCHRLPCC